MNYNCSIIHIANLSHCLLTIKSADPQIPQSPVIIELTAASQSDCKSKTHTLPTVDACLMGVSLTISECSTWQSTKLKDTPLTPSGAQKQLWGIIWEHNWRYWSTSSQQWGNDVSLPDFWPPSHATASHSWLLLMASECLWAKRCGSVNSRDWLVGSAWWWWLID